MSRFSHDSEILLADFETAKANFRQVFPSAFTPPDRYGFMFPGLQNNPANLLPEHKLTARNLILLGQAMEDSEPTKPALDSSIPAAYTYFGQFVAHDVSLEVVTRHVPLNEHVLPLSAAEILEMKNARSPGLDLDSVYGPGILGAMVYEVPRKGDHMVIERAIEGPEESDLPRDPNPQGKHPALIGDQRNDEHLIISQMHLAFLRVHNILVSQGASFEEARRILRQHYQWIVINDFLPRIADDQIVQKVLNGSINIYDPPDDNWVMPLEFSVGAFRFGHSMIRDIYNYNHLFDEAQLFQILLPGPLVTYNHILADWLIDWRRFVAQGANVARRIDTRLAVGLSQLDNGRGRPLPFGLSVMDLLRGYLLRLPTGQAVARALGVQHLEATDIERLAGEPQKKILQDSGFSERTPLWFYVLVEAAATPSARLAELGTILVASVLIGLIRRSKDSYLRYPNWTPTLGSGGRFDLSDLFRLAGVLRPA